ncbi:efflux RND transporter periplasmic adaptor subunit [Microbulbifer litoralis]|uniref:efflux RND transporter periplasmic adaptor subunit n=1 Tax=Microbulbifer litoralis TaxID=2933965 RepID=UPI002027F5DD|nr:efflux RND transporter periplasmic adaptor subunit [Microbulbifer sp. GX H0434]
MDEQRTVFRRFSTRACKVGALALVVALLGNCSESNKENAIGPIPRLVDTALVQRADNKETVVLAGEVQAAEQSALSFEVEGEIKHIFVDVGDPVEAGQVLAELDESRYQLANALAISNEMEALAAYRERKLDYDRHLLLIDKGVISQAQLDNSKASMETLKSRYESARVSRMLAERDLRLTRLKAPFSGSVSQRLVEPSERVAPNQVLLEVISDRDGYEIETNLPENLIGRIEERQRHLVELPALGIKDISARISQIGTQSRSSNTYPVILKIENAVPALRSGMTAEVHLTLESARGRQADRVPGLAIPLTSLIYDVEEKAHVLRVSEERRLERVDVEVISLYEGHANITGNLLVGDRIVSRGGEFIAAGDAVTILGEGPERFN